MKRIIKLIVLIAWMSLIFFMSSQNGQESANVSGGVLYLIAKILNVKDVAGFIGKYGFLIRKTAHFSEYFILALLAYINLIEYKVNKKFLISIIICVIYAASDEFHQGFVDGRAPGIFDVCIDSFGSLCALALSYLVSKRCYQEKKL